jgi:predicted Zn-ribbon and HTH transcriptional regulator
MTTAKKTVADYPHLVSQWHPTKNGDARPEHIAAGTKKKVWWLCPVCKHEWQASPEKRTIGRGCPSCAGTIPTLYNCLGANHPELSEEVFPTAEYPLMPLEVTKNSKKKLNWKCRDCGHQWVTSPCHRVIMGSGCPRCKNSKLEKIVYDILLVYGVKFKFQHTEENCKKQKVLPFDFGVFRDGKIVALIECQGIHHFKPKSFGSKNKTTEKIHEEVKENDNIKRQYCRDNNIPLLEIPYYWTKVQNKIEDELTVFFYGMGVVFQKPDPLVFCYNEEISP